MLDIFEKINAVSDKKPEKLSIVDRYNQITYLQLRNIIDNTAQALIEQRLENDALVIIHLPQSVRFITLILSALRVKLCFNVCAYDTSSENVLNKCKILKPDLIVTTQEKLKLFSGHNVVTEEKLVSENIDFTKWPQPTNDAAYVIQTSGSTSKPKQIVVSYHALNSMLQCIAPQNLPIFKRHLILFHPEFDGYLASIFWTLSFGGTIYDLFNNIEKLDIKAVLKAINQHQVTNLLLLPIYYKKLLNFEHSHNDLESLKAVVLAGESFTKNLVNTHYTNLPETELYNAYGTSETCIWNSIYKFSLNEDFDTISIGKPTQNSGIMLLNDTHHKSDEYSLYITGPCLSLIKSKRYRKINDAKHEKINGEYHYKTGDYAKRDHNGNYTIMGRTKDYIKVSGFRVNLEEIRNTIKSNSIAHDAHLMLNNIHDIHQETITVYLEMKNIPESNFEKEKLIQNARNKLKEYLPSYHIPSRIKIVGTIPRLKSGKIHEKKLIEQEQNYCATPANNDLESTIIGIFKNFLNLETVDRNTNFLSSGGDSLLAIDLLIQLKKITDIPLTAIDILENPSVVELADFIARNENQLTSKDVLKILKKSNSNVSLICVPPAAGISNFYFPFSSNFSLNIEIASVNPLQAINEVGEHSIKELSKTYIVEMEKTIGSAKDILLCGFSFGGYVALEMACQMQKMKTQPKLLILFDIPYVYNKSIDIDIQSEEFLEFLKNNFDLNDYSNLKNSTLNDMDDTSGFSSPHDIDKTKIIKKLMKLYKLNELALKTYEYSTSKLKTPILMFKCTQPSEDPLFLSQDVDSNYIGWQKNLYTVVETINIDCKHENLFSNNNLPILSKQLANFLAYFLKPGDTP